MLFNSFFFLLVYLPAAMAGFFLIGGRRPGLAAGWLAAASLAFYAWWSVSYFPLLLGSIIGNFAFGIALSRLRAAGRRAALRSVFTAAIALNLGLLGYYKYRGFAVANFGTLLGYDWPAGEQFIPLGISFFTFTQIAYLADVYAGRAREYRPVHYGLFVTFFPHLIAGPILHHREMMPQFMRQATYRFTSVNLAVGLTIFLIGLFKKVVLADSIAPAANAVFDGAAAGASPGAAMAWLGALAYALQLYFDFSGYSDMAIGLARLFGIRFPVNFDSPYKASSMIEFWRRWHMTLSRFLRDYLYIPLGGNRLGARRRYVNLLATMLLGGLWHGAGWTFLAWGGIHGLLLAANHGWRAVVARAGWQWPRRRAWAAVAHGLTFVAVLLAWVPFRAADWPTATHLWLAMVGLGTAATPAVGPLHPTQLVLLGALLVVTWLFPNTQEVMRRYHPSIEDGMRQGSRPVARFLEWRPRPYWICCITLIALTTLFMMANRTHTEFLYFQF